MSITTPHRDDVSLLTAAERLAVQIAPHDRGQWFQDWLSNAIPVGYGRGGVARTAPCRTWKLAIILASSGITAIAESIPPGILAHSPFAYSTARDALRAAFEFVYGNGITPAGQWTGPNGETEPAFDQRAHISPGGLARIRAAVSAAAARRRAVGVH